MNLNYNYKEQELFCPIKHYILANTDTRSRQTFLSKEQLKPTQSFELQDTVKIDLKCFFSVYSHVFTHFVLHVIHSGWSAQVIVPL